MENQDYKKEVELRSEKVRNIVGKVPPNLVRYGMITIILVIFVFLIIMDYLPYKQEFIGKAIVYEIPISTKDSVDVIVELALPDIDSYHLLINKKIQLSNEEFNYVGSLIKYSVQKETNGMNRSVLRIANKQLPKIKQSQFKYKLTVIETTMFKRFFILKNN
jgi:hypothetical protein